MVEYHTPDELLTRSTLWKIIKAYVPNEYLETVDDAKFSSMEFTKNDQEELVQYVLDNSNHKMRMYGSAKDLTGILNAYRSFPMSHKFFECERSEPYNSDLRLYRGNNGENYISKDSVFVYIQSLINLNLVFSRFPHNSLILTLFLKVQEEKLKNSLEFIPWDDELVKYVESELEVTVEAARKEVHASENHPKHSLIDFIDLFTKLLPESCTAEEIASVRENVIGVYHFPKDGWKVSTEPILSTYIEIKHLLDLVKRLSEKTPHMFCRWIDVPPETKFKVPAIVRLFAVGSNESSAYFIEAELEEALKIYQTGHAQPSRTIEGNFLYTINDDAARKKYGKDKMDGLQILQDDTLVAHPEFTPIPTNFGVFVVSGLHAFYRLFRRVIFVHKVFQKLTENNMEPFSRYIEIIAKVLDFHGTRKYMLKLDFFYRLEKMTADYWNKTLPQPAKDVRNAKSDGFTLQNLKNELVHLGLTNAFPNILDYAERAYVAVSNAKRDEHLRTCDLYAAIETCQLPCIIVRYPIVDNFLKAQGVNRWNMPTETLPMDLVQTVTLKRSEESETSVGTKEEPEDTETKKENDELKKVKAQLKAAQDVIKHLKDPKLDEKLSQWMMEYEFLKKELERYSNVASEIKDLKRKVETGEQREQKLKEANQSLTDSIEEIKKNMRKLEAEKLRAAETNNELNERMVDLKGEVKNAKELLRTAESRLENEVSQRSQEMERTTETNKKLNEKIVDLKAEVQSAESRLESVTVEKTQMSREISNLKEETKRDAELILKLEGEVKKEQKHNERQKLESEVRLEVEKTNHAVDQIQLKKEFEKLREAHNDLSDECDRKDQIIRDLRNRLSKYPGGLS